MPTRLGSATPFAVRVIHGAKNIQHFLIAPVGIDGFCVLNPAPAAAPVIHLCYGKTSGCHHLRNDVERIVILRHGATVDKHDQRQFFLLHWRAYTECRRRVAIAAPALKAFYYR